jgi:hypothetical protein
VGRNAAYFGGSPTFQRNLSPPSIRNYAKQGTKAVSKGNYIEEIAVF